ncbi:uncharacterized protein LOC135824914 [Sycon ciliatum]|uniref:uncharacterized protein LOC135824914 n=1 Tax=Sycon ciliatum TaxID=27933 RepID=UPI0031F6F7AC
MQSPSESAPDSQPGGGRGVSQNLRSLFTHLVGFSVAVLLLQQVHLATRSSNSYKFRPDNLNALQAASDATSASSSAQNTKSKKDVRLSAQLFRLAALGLAAALPDRERQKRVQDTEQGEELFSDVEEEAEDNSSVPLFRIQSLLFGRENMQPGPDTGVCYRNMEIAWKPGESRSKDVTWAWPSVTIRDRRCGTGPRLRLCCRPRKQILILMWNKVFRSTFLPQRDKPYPFLCCDGVQLSYTTKRSYQFTADVIEYHMEDSYAIDPTRHTAKDKISMLFVMEAQREWTRLRRPFNLLRSFINTADIYQPYFAGGGSCLCNQTLRALPVPFKLKLKTAPMLALVTNCRSHSGREGLLQSLIAAIPTHSYGHCFHNKHGVVNDSVALATHYKFTVAAENSICDEYITEKFFRLFKAGSVPVVVSVNGKPGYEALSPTPHSYLDVARFDSADDAANEILMASASVSQYMKYHTYRPRATASSAGAAPVVSTAYMERVCSEKEGYDTSWCFLAKQMSTEGGRQTLASTWRTDIRPARHCIPKGSLMKRYPVPNTSPKPGM